MFAGGSSAAVGDENNLLYVACTRAKKCLIMSPKLALVLRAAGVRQLCSLERNNHIILVVLPFANEKVMIRKFNF
jgi:hypothetical protein